MNKIWLGYLSSVLFLFAGILMTIDGKAILGGVFIVLAIANTILQIYMRKHSK